MAPFVVRFLLISERIISYPNSITVQYAAAAASLESMARCTLAYINPDLTIASFKSLDYQVADNFNGEHLLSPLTGLFGLLALALASVGLYGIPA